MVTMYVLMILGNGKVFSHDFNSREQCEQAKAQIEMSVSYFDIWCTPK